MQRQKSIVFDFNAALAHLQQTDTPLSPAALGVLSNASKAHIAAFAKTWVQLPTNRRVEIARMLVKLAEDNFELDFDLLFRYLLSDDEPKVRAAGIEGLWEDEDSALVKPLVGFLRSDPNAAVRAVAADALGRFVLLGEYGRLSDGHIELISQALLATTRSSSEDLLTRCRAVEALAYWSDPIVRSVIAAAYTDPEPEMRASAVAAMGRSADRYWAQIVRSELDSPEPRMRFEAARAAGELENRAATPRLIKLLEDPDREVQSAAIIALGQIGGKAAHQALTCASQSDDEVQSALAQDALQELAFTSSNELLLFDQDDQGDGWEDELDEDEEEEEWDDDLIEDDNDAEY
jgi:hypothetical protein